MVLVDLTASLAAAGPSDRTIEAIVVRCGDVVALTDDFLLGGVERAEFVPENQPITRPGQGRVHRGRWIVLTTT